ncbi:MAG: ferric reductase-like transmembrane domain-containing protein [Microvirga sp.]|nr:ferric reductase-like transmembrane domain-containing protein [Microvirga sp.]
MTAKHDGASGGVLAALYIGIVAGGLALAVATGISPDGPWAEAATASGVAALAMIALQFFSSGRFRRITGRIGIDRAIAFHRWAAGLLLAAVILHPLLYAVPTFLIDPALGVERVSGMFLAPRARTGLVAWLAIVAIVPIAWLRDRIGIPYEWWRATHIGLGATALGAGVVHALSVGTYAGETWPAAYWIALGGAALATLLIVHIWRRIGFRRDPWRLASKTSVGRGLWELAFSRDSGAPFPYRAGQFVWLVTAPRLAPLFDHPFSVASSPRERELRLVVKEVGDYTRGIGSFPEGLAAGIDGPHGIFTADPEAKGFLLLAGGAGIAPVLGILRDFDLASETRPIRVVVAAGGPDRIVARREIEAMTRRLDLSARFVVDTAGPDWDGETGILDAALVAPSLDGLPVPGTQALICGPTAFMTSLADILVDRGFPADHVHYERFDYSGGPLSRIDRAERLRYRLLGLAVAIAILAFALRG